LAVSTFQMSKNVKADTESSVRFLD